MRKIAVVLAAVIGSVCIAGCQADFTPQDTDGYVKEIVNDVKEQAVQELKKAFASEVSDFLASDDLSVTLGMTGEEKEQLENSIRETAGHRPSGQRQDGNDRHPRQGDQAPG